MQTLHFFKLCKNAKSYKNSKILKNDGNFQIPHPQINFKKYSNIYENVVYFLDYNM